MPAGIEIMKKLPDYNYAKRIVSLTRNYILFRFFSYPKGCDGISDLEILTKLISHYYTLAYVSAFFSIINQQFSEKITLHPRDLFYIFISISCFISARKLSRALILFNKENPNLNQTL